MSSLRDAKKAASSERVETAVDGATTVGGGGGAVVGGAVTVCDGVTVVVAGPPETIVGLVVSRSTVTVIVTVIAAMPAICPVDPASDTGAADAVVVGISVAVNGVCVIVAVMGDVVIVKIVDVCLLRKEDLDVSRPPTKLVAREVSRDSPEGLERVGRPLSVARRTGAPFTSEARRSIQLEMREAGLTGRREEGRVLSRWPVSLESAWCSRPADCGRGGRAPTGRDSTGVASAEPGSGAPVRLSISTAIGWSASSADDPPFSKVAMTPRFSCRSVAPAVGGREYTEVSRGSQPDV